MAPRESLLFKISTKLDIVALAPSHHEVEWSPRWIPTTIQRYSPGPGVWTGISSVARPRHRIDGLDSTRHGPGKIHRCRRDFNSHIRTYPRFSDQIKKNASNTVLHQCHFLIGDFLIYQNHQISQFTYFGIYADDFGVREHGTLYFTRPKLRRCISASRTWCTVNERRDFAKL